MPFSVSLERFPQILYKVSEGFHILLVHPTIQFSCIGHEVDECAEFQGDVKI